MPLCCPSLLHWWKLCNEKRKKEKRSSYSFCFLCLKSNRKQTSTLLYTVFKVHDLYKRRTKNQTVYRDPSTSERERKPLTRLSNGTQGEPLHNHWHWTELQNSLPDTWGNHVDSSVIKQGFSHLQVYRPTSLQFAPIISVNVMLRTPGAWVHLGDWPKFQHTVVSQICREAECPLVHWSTPFYLCHNLINSILLIICISSRLCIIGIILQNGIHILLGRMIKKSCFCLVIKSQSSSSHGFSSSGIFTFTSTLFMDAPSFSMVGSTRALFFLGGWGVSLYCHHLRFQEFSVCSFLFSLQYFSVTDQMSSLEQPFSSCPLHIVPDGPLELLTVSGVHVFEYSAFWHAFILLFYSNHCNG